MTNALRELLERALDALSCEGGDDDPDRRYDYVDRNVVLRADIRAALAAPQAGQAEPVGDSLHDAVYRTIVDWDYGGKRSRRELTRRIMALCAPPKRTPLTDERVGEIVRSIWRNYDPTTEPVLAAENLARAIERAHGIVGGGE